MSEANNNFETKLEQTAETLIKGCSKIRTRYSWFGTTAKIDDETLQEMIGASTPEEVRKALSVYKRLLKSSHPAMKAAKDCFQSIKDYITGMSIPMIMLRQTDDEESNLRKDGGVRLIQKKDMEEFDEHMQYLISVLSTSVKSLQEAMPEIMEEDKERLGKVNAKLFNKSDYPKDVTKLIKVQYNFEPIGVDADWEKLCPKIYERESLNAREKFALVVESAAVEFADQFVKYVKNVVDQLGNRVRLNPRPGHDRLFVIIGDSNKEVCVSEAEVVTRLNGPDEVNDILDGYVLLELRLANTKGKSPIVWLEEPIKEKYYFEMLRPYESGSERKKLYDSTVANLKHKLDTFLNIGEMLGPYKEVISKSVTEVKRMLTDASSNLDVGQITSQLREGSYFRNKMKSTLEGVAHTVQSAMSEAKETRKTIKKSLIGKV